MSTVVLLIIGVVLLVLLAAALTFVWTGVPYVPTPPFVVREMIALAGIQPRETVYDLGCGDGRLLRAAKGCEPSIRAIGFELSPVPYGLAKAKGIRTGISVHFRSFFDAPLGDADVIFLYQLPHIMRWLQPKFDRELQRGTRVVSHGFTFPDRQPVRTVKLEKLPTIFGVAHPAREPKVYLYEW